MVKYFNAKNLTKKKTEKETYSLKDNICTIEYPTTSSSNFLKNFLSGWEATVVKLLKKKNYWLLGKTTLDELSCGGTGLLSNAGLLYNPFNKKHIIGGSSSGSALVVAKNFVDFSIASDTGGSVRVPASYCGLIGFKPSYGKISRLGLMPVCSSLDTIGILSKKIKTVENVFFDLTVLDPLDLWTLKQKKISSKNKMNKNIILFNQIENFLSLECKKAYQQTKVILKKEDFLIKEINIPSFIKQHLLSTWINICFTELVSNLNSFQGITFGNKKDEKTDKIRTNNINTTVKKRLLIGAYFLEKKQETHWIKNKIKEWFNNLLQESIVIFPTTCSEAPKIKQKSFFSLTQNEHWTNNLILLSNLNQNPSINIPFTDSLLPVGISINAKIGGEEEIFSLSKLLIKKE